MDTTSSWRCGACEHGTMLPQGVATLSGIAPSFAYICGSCGARSSEPVTEAARLRLRDAMAPYADYLESVSPSDERTNS